MTAKLMNMIDIQNKKNNKDPFLKEDNTINNINKFFLINEVNSINLIEANIIIHSGQNESNYHIINFEEKILKKEKDINHLINGIIFISSALKKQNLDEIIEYIYQIDKKIIKKGKIVPKIIFGNKQNIINSLKRGIGHFNKLKNIKFLKETPDDHNEIINIALEELIKMKNIYNNYEDLIKQNEINEDDIIKNISENEFNLIRCKKCNQVFNISFNNYSNLFYLNCPICQIKKKDYSIEEFEKFINFEKCNTCEIENNINSCTYCSKCKKFFCKECIKNHSKKEKENDKYKINDIMCMCIIHNRICNIFCNNCKKNICIECEIESHMEHETIIFDELKIDEIINNQKEILNKERENIEIIKGYIEDFLQNLRKKFDNLIKTREKMLNIVEKMIKNCEIFRYDITLLDNIKNLNFRLNKNINSNDFDSWMKKLKNIFELFNEPIKIETIKVFKEENLEGPYDILKQIVLKSNENPDNIENITDICPLFSYNSKNYFAVSYDSGVLKIYNDDFKNRVPKKIIEKLFEKREGIISLYKSGKKALILVGYSKIKKIIFSEDLENYKVLYQIQMENQLFKNIIELDCFNILIANNNLNQLLCINYINGNEVSDITTNIDDKEIVYIEKISETKIILKLNEFNPFKNIEIYRNTIIIEKEAKDDVVNGIKLKSNNEIYIPNKSKHIFWEIIDFDIRSNNIEITKNYPFEKNISYLGKLKDFEILLFNYDNNKLSIFDINNYYYTYEFFFNYIQKPLVSFPLEKSWDSLNILILLEEGNIIQYTLDLVNKEIYQNGRIEINNKNIKKNNYFDLNGDNNNNENKNNIVKIIDLHKNNYLIINEDYSFFNLIN